MKRSVMRMLSGMIIISLLLFDIIPAVGFEEGKLVATSWTEETHAAEEDGSGYSFLIGNKEINNGDTIDYSKYNNADNTLWITLKSTAGIASGTAIKWTVSNENIVKVDTQDDASCRAKLNIISPGYSGLTVTITTPNGITYSAVAYCSIYVPLEWSDNVSTSDPTMNNIRADYSNGKYYGLFIAQTGTTDYTLQMYTEESSDFPNCYHYLRKLKYVSYKYKSGSGLTGNVTSDVAPDKLGEFTAALTWETSDPTVVEVDTLTGMIRAKGAGFARITVRTNTINEMAGEGEDLSFNVVVVPEGYVSGYTTDYDDKFTVITDPNTDDIIVQTNAKYAKDLSWKIYQGDAAIASKDITKKLEANTEIGEATGRVVLSNLSAGVYYVTAIPVKDSASSKLLATYEVEETNLQYLGITIIVPLKFPQDTLTLNYYNSSMFDEYDLLGNSNLPAGAFRFNSSDANVASVGVNDGLIEAEGVGDCRITVNKLNDKVIQNLFGSYAASASAINYDGSTYGIDVKVINGISLSSTSETLSLGATLPLVLTSPNPYEGDVYWSSNDTKIVTVDESGLVTAVGVGDATVTVKIKVNGVTKRARCKIKVVSSINSISLSAKENFVAVGDNLTISAAITPKMNNASLSWNCSDTSIASIADTSALAMTITGVKPGTVVITAVNTENAVVGSIVIKVVQDIASITLSDTEVTLAQSTGFYQLYATCVPSLPENQVLTWSSSNSKIITVDANGKVTLVKPGTAVITVVTENGLLATCSFTVTQGVSSIALDDTSLQLYVGEAHRMTYVITPKNASETTLKWASSDTKIATVDATGYVTGKNVGTCVVTAQATDGTGIFVMCTVTVLRTAKSIKFDVTTLSMNVGEIYVLETLLTPADSSDIVTYESSDSKVATVNKRGKITAKSKGTSVIMGKTPGGLTTFCTVTVLQQVSGIELSEDEATIYVDEVLELEAIIEPKTASDTDVTWSSNNDAIASVNKRGEVTGKSGGTTLIKCTTEDGDYMAYCIVTVLEYVTTITVEENAEVGVDKKLQLNATVSGEKATNKTVIWSTSNKKICTVNKNGVITGVKVGKATITVTAADGSDVSATCEVKVINATEGLEVEPTYITLIIGESEKIIATITPSNATYTPDWSSADETIAIVNKKGVVTGVKAGSTVITATAKDDPAIKAITYVSVIAPVNATSVTFAESEVIMTPGESKTVPYSIVPANYTESFTWSSDNPVVATVNETTGRITANSVGSATITLMTKSGRKGNVKVFVVGLSKTYVELHQYESLLIKLEIDGTGSSALTLRWDTDNQTIAEIVNGRITAKALGSTKVYAVVNGRMLACTVKVIKNK